MIIDDVRRQVTGTFLSVRDDGVAVDLEFKEADCWGFGIAVVGEFVATNCEADAVSFGFGELDVTDKVGICNFFVLGFCVSGDKEDGVGPVNVFVWKA